MKVYLALLAAAAIVSLLVTPLVSTAARALGLVDAPGGRKVHLQSVPRVGGIVLAVAGTATLAAFAWIGGAVGGPVPALHGLGALLISAGLVLGIGLIDDLTPLPVWPRVLIQLAAALVVMSSGTLIERVTIAGTTWQLGFAAWPVTAVWIVGLTNAFNLIDGLDGLAAGVAVIAGTACTLILASRGHAGEAALLATLVGAAAGFLVFNFAPASIFLGDGGSLLIGFLLATTAVTGWQKGATALAAGVPLLLFALPLADAAAAIVRRARPRDRDEQRVWQVLRQIGEPDRLHIHHRLTNRGWAPVRAVLALYVVTAVLSVLALASATTDAGVSVLRASFGQW